MPLDLFWTAVAPPNQDPDKIPVLLHETIGDSAEILEMRQVKRWLTRNDRLVIRALHQPGILDIIEAHPPRLVCQILIEP